MPAESPSERNFRITNNNAIDKHVGRRVRLRRTLLGMSQEQLGAELNITFQQVQKYERDEKHLSLSGHIIVLKTPASESGLPTL